MSDKVPDELNYATSTEANIRILRAMGEIHFMEKMKVLMPLVAEELVKAGVDFSKARFDEASALAPVLTPTDLEGEK